MLLMGAMGAPEGVDTDLGAMIDLFVVVAGIVLIGG